MDTLGAFVIVRILHHIVHCVVVGLVVRNGDSALLATLLLLGRYVESPLSLLDSLFRRHDSLLVCAL